MSARATPYTGGVKRRQTVKFAGIAGFAVLALALAGCSAARLPFGPSLVPQFTTISADTVGAVSTQASVVDTVAPSDWESIRRLIATIPPGETRTVDWTNPDTRSTGALTVGTVAEGAPNAPTCRTFVTTVSDPRGVRRYRGTACREVDGRWGLTAVAADDALFS